MRRHAADVVQGIYDAFRRGDMPAVLGAMAEDIEWHEAEGGPYGGVHRGPAAVVENVFGPVGEDVADFAATPEELIASGDTVVVVARYTGTGTAGGNTLDLQAVHIWDVGGAEVVRFRQFVDTVKFLEVVPSRSGARS